MINLIINNQKISVEPGTTVLAAAKRLKINIPTLCNHDDLCVAGNCRVCVVEQTGARTLIAACAMPVLKVWIFIQIHLRYVMHANILLNFFLQNTGQTAQNVIKIRTVNFSHLANEFAFGDTIFLDLVEDHNYTVDRSSPSFIKDDSKCIRCQRCVRTCEELQYISAIAVANKGCASEDIFIPRQANEPCCLYKLRPVREPLSYRCTC